MSWDASWHVAFPDFLCSGSQARRQVFRNARGIRTCPGGAGSRPICSIWHCRKLQQEAEKGARDPHNREARNLTRWQPGLGASRAPPGLPLGLLS